MQILGRKPGLDEVRTERQADRTVSESSGASAAGVAKRSIVERSRRFPAV
jgi:hypothetical protein